MVYFSCFGTKCISLCQLGLIILVCHFIFYHQISFKTINSGEGDIMVLYKVTVCVLILYISESFQFSVVGEIAT